MVPERAVLRAGDQQLADAVQRPPGLDQCAVVHSPHPRVTSGAAPALLGTTSPRHPRERIHDTDYLPVVAATGSGPARLPRTASLTAAACGVWCPRARRGTGAAAPAVGGDEAAFSGVVRGWSPAMLRVARMYVNTHASAEEVVQETWLAVLRGMHGFEGRAMFRTWVFRILANQARKRGKVESRAVLSSWKPAPPSTRPGSVARGDPYSGHWRADACRWSGPGAGRAGRRVSWRARRALALLPERQRAVVELRDVHGLDSDEVCELLDLTGEPAGAAAPRPGQAARRPRGALPEAGSRDEPARSGRHPVRRGRRTGHRLPRGCAAAERGRGGHEATWRSAEAAMPTSSRCARRSTPWHGAGRHAVRRGVRGAGRRVPAASPGSLSQLGATGRRSRIAAFRAAVFGVGFGWGGSIPMPLS